MTNRATLLLCVFFLAGCLSVESASTEQNSLTRQFIRISREVPTFGGITRENNEWIVFLLGETQRGAAGARLQEILQETALHVVMRIRPARGSSSEEKKDRATEVLNVPGVSSIDFDEVTGYLRVGLVDVESIELAQAKLDELAIPRAEVLFQAVPGLVGW
ncbi:MAG: hypothetical protein ABW123_19375 [Cystobacter sp.]